MMIIMIIVPKNKNMVWDLKAVAFKYCQQDCITFYQIIDKFRSKIFK